MTKFKWIQYSVAAHVSKKAIEFLTANFRVVVRSTEWPSNGPNLNPCDYQLWSEQRRKVNSEPHNNLTTLKSFVKRNMAAFSTAEVVKACSIFVSRLEIAVKANGVHIV